MSFLLPSPSCLAELWDLVGGIMGRGRAARKDE